MTSRKKTPYKRKVSVLAGLEALNSFKVPKKQNKLSLLENIGLNSVDYLEEIYPQINQSFRFPQLSPHFEVEEAWLIHNKTLEDSFSQARKRLQKNPITNAITGTESSLCTGFLAVKDWKDVENIAADGLGPGNDPDTWLGQPKLGLSVNQCADLTIAREQSRFLSKDIDQFLYLIMVRWVKSRAYIVSPEAQNSKDRLEPQPGYACHVSTWSRMDLLDPSKLTLEQAFHLSQVSLIQLSLLYEFDEDLELRTKLDHVVPYAVLKCRWRLTSEVASKLDPLSAASGSILIISPQQPDITCLRSTTRTALLPTPQIPRIHKTSSRRQLKTSSTSDFESKLKPKNRRSNVTRGKNPYSPPAINSTTVGIDENSEQLTSPNQQFKQQTTGFLNLLIAHARRLQASCELFEFSECSKINNNSSNASVNDNISSNSLTSLMLLLVNYRRL
ncbi:unnamed protein product [Heterobilharzia americana]|nr:unnamed protein product [Heterobilharzia americana]